MDQADRSAAPDPQPGRLAEAVERGDQHSRRLTPLPQFAFVQLEFPWALGPADGRYILRAQAGEPPTHVLVLQTLGAARGQRRRRPRRAKPEPGPAAVAVTRVTVIAAQPFDGPDPARDWLAHLEAEQEVGRAVQALNGALAAHRVAAQDPHCRDVSGEQALVVRAGFGAGEEVADGLWAQASELPPGRSRRRGRDAALRPQERLAALLGARDEALACEQLALAARLALDGGRGREAALVLETALRAALAELSLGGQTAGMSKRVSELSGRQGAVSDAARTALGAMPDQAQLRAVGETLERLEAALRARAAAGGGGAGDGVR